MRTRGFTLIELMISIALFGLIAAGAMSLVISGARTQSHSARVDVAQTSLRTAIDFITRDVMGAASGSNGGVLTLSGGSTANAIVFDTTANNITSTSPYVDHSDRLELYNIDGNTMAQLSANAAAGAASLAILSEDPRTGASNKFVAQSSPYQSYVQIFDPNAKLAAVVQLGGATSTTLTLLQTLPTAFSAYAAYVVPSRHVTYFVSNTQFASTSTSNGSMLMMSLNGTTNTSNAAPLAEGVEDMQVAYGFDTNNDGVVTESTTPTANDDEWLYNCANESPTVAMTVANLRTIRVTLVVKSTSVATGQQNLPARPAAEDNTPGTADGFIRRVLRTEIAVRNFQ